LVQPKRATQSSGLQWGLSQTPQAVNRHYPKRHIKHPTLT